MYKKNNNTIFIHKSRIVKYDFPRKRKSYRIEVKSRDGYSTFNLTFLPTTTKTFYIDYGEYEEGKIIGNKNKVLGKYKEVKHGFIITWR